MLMIEQDTETGVQKMEENYLDFLDDNEDQGTYTDLVKEMISERKYRLIVDINDVRKKFPERAAGLLKNIFEEHEQFQKALKRFVETIDSDYAQKHFEFHIGFSGSFGKNHVSPRTLTSPFLGKLVCVEGIVTKCTTVRVKFVKSVHYCPATNEFLNREHKDLTSFNAAPAAGVFPKKDKNENPLEMEFGLSVYKDHQTISIQELPEVAPPGQMPRSLDIILDNDLVDKCKPGDRIKAVGSFRCLPGKHSGYTSGTFRTVLIANHIIQMSKEVSLTVDNEDVVNCKKLSIRFPHKIVDMLSKSLAPSIYGHEYVKKAILLLLLGGTEKVLSNGTRLRGDINVLLIGDPSVAKSQLLRYVLCTAPRAIPTTGRGSSGVGLTAAVTTDQESGERRLEAGAMVLADRGVICIDEFDKMTDIDRTAIHEVMEQGRVTIAKAGIHATLNARCSVLAAANPVYGRYDPYKTPMDNIGLQDSLLSRFDLLFVLLDKSDPDLDKMISDHVVRMHRYRSPREQDGEPLSLEVGSGILSTKNLEIMDSENANSEIYEKYDPLLHGNMRSKSEKIFTVTFMRKYVHIAKMMKPELTEEATKAISDEYSNLRSQEEDPKVARTQPVTARTLETLIRLSTAHAKARLSKKVTIDDANAAIELIQYAYFKRVLQREKKKRAKNDSDSESEEVISSEKTKRSLKRASSRTPDDPGDVYAYVEEEDDSQPKRIKKRKTTQTVVPEVPEQMEIDTPEETPEEVASLTPPMDNEPVTVPPEKYNLFLKYLNELFTKTRTETLEINQVEQFVMKKNPEFTKQEIRAALEMMSAENSIMITGNEIMRI